MSSSRRSSRRCRTSAAAASPGVLHERYRTNRAVRELLERLAATKPLVLILDDFHWADPASVDLAASLLHRPPAAACCSCWPPGPTTRSPRLRSALGHALRAGELTRIELDPLTSEEAAAMLGRESLRRRSRSAVRGVGRQPVLLGAAGPRVGRRGSDGARGGGLGRRSCACRRWSWRRWSEELALLSAGSRRVLQGASVAGDPFEPELAAAASDVGEPEAMDAIDELLSAELIRPTDVPRRFRFRHPIVRRAVYEASPAAWRIGAHDGSPRPSLTVAPAPWPAPSTSTPPPRWATRPPWPRSPRLAGSPRSARRRQRRDGSPVRCACCPRPLPPTSGSSCSPPPPRRWRRPAASPMRHEALVESLALVDADATALRVQLVAACARVEHLLGRHEQAHARLAAALEDLPDAAGAAAVSLMLELAADEVYRLRYHAGQAWAQQAVDAAQGASAIRYSIAAALATLARAFSWGGDPTAGRAGPRPRRPRS